MLKNINIDTLKLKIKQNVYLDLIHFGMTPS